MTLRAPLEGKTMKARLTDARGLSLVEATIILMVLSILTGVIASSGADYLNDARQTKAKEDVEALGTAIMRVLRDTGLPCLTIDNGSAPCNHTNRVELLLSGSTTSAGQALGSSTDFTRPAGTNVASGAALNWLAAGAGNPVGAAWRDTVENQLLTGVLSGTDYTGASFSAGGGPKAGLGWRGAYLSGPVGLDPWGHAYQASTLFLTVATNATGGSTPFEGVKGWTSDVIVLSPGIDGTVTTLFGDMDTAADDDDVIYVVQGATR